MKIMRKVIVGLMVVGLLAVAGQVQAQNNGTADPLGLISSAAIQPFWSAGAQFTILEITSPEFFNTFPALHAFFFDAACNKDQSVNLPVTQNGFVLFTPDDLGIDYHGLAVIVASFDNLTAVPIGNDRPIHVKGHWVNFANDYIRVLDSIAVDAAETNPQQTWNTLRSGADWSNPIEGLNSNTTIFLVCPGPAITTTPTGLLAPPSGIGFPPAPRIAFGPKTANLIGGVIYDENEKPLRNIVVPCFCITPLPVLTINSVYGDPTATGSDFYTELFTYSIVPGTTGDPAVTGNPNTFTGYRSIVKLNPLFAGGQLDQFGRLNNASASALQRMVPFTPGLR